MRRRYRAPVAYSLDLNRTNSPRVVALDTVAWWRVRQQMVEAAMFALTFSLIGMLIVAVVRQVLGHG